VFLCFSLEINSALFHDRYSDAPGIPSADQHSQADTSDVLSAYSAYDELLSDVTPDAGTVKTPSTIVEDRTDKDDDNESTYSDYLDQRANSPPPMFAQKATPPHLQLQKVDTVIAQNVLNEELEAASPQSIHSNRNKPLPKSPGAASPFAAFFGWGGNPSPSGTEFSISSPSSPSGRGGSGEGVGNRSRTTESTTPNAASSNALGYSDSYLSASLPSSQSSFPIDEMEDELRAISHELASSIRREMDLEDLVDRLQEQASSSQAPSKRTSDYFSDSGYSSTKASESEQARDEIDKIQRRAEQEKASIRLELTTKLQDERARRKALDQQIKELAEKASQIDLAQINNLDANERVKDLETTCEDLRRRLSDERSSRSNFEDLLSALKSELQEASNERDNLRDEVVPQLRARVEGLEAEAAEYTNLTYESSKMQQELQNLRSENMTLKRSSIVGPIDVQNRASRAFSGGLSGGLSRSNSVAGGPMRGQRPTGLGRSNSVRGGPQTESREALSERLKDVEAQRDALHGALKSLLERQEVQNRQYQKKIQLLENERQRLLTGPGKKGFEREIMNLRTEINVLRRRAEDALDQKWQVEKGLSGLKMDLDRAEGEIASLRELLNEKDILIPETMARMSGSDDGEREPVTSESLSQAYEKLQAAYAESLERIKNLESGINDDEKTKVAMRRLERAVSVAITERDFAKSEMDAIRNRYDEAYANETRSVQAESALADELCETARYVETLASQVQQQLSANSELRMRLADAVTRGDADRKANNDRITAMMEHLGALEEQLVSAQSGSEDQVTRHEEEVSKLRDAHNFQLQRIGGSPGLGGLRSPAVKGSRSGSMLSKSRSKIPFPDLIEAQSFEDEAEMTSLRAKVAELEKALSDAENEMQEVITRMSTAQIEVLNLQEERDRAVRETRKLQKILEGEQAKPVDQRFTAFR
jgi:chromosome segregation ATPase